jgi:hypothetical protein
VIKLSALTQASFSEPNLANPAIVLTRPNDDQALRFERTQEAADVCGIELKPASQIPDVGPLDADLPQQPRFAKRMVSTEEVVI